MSKKRAMWMAMAYGVITLSLFAPSASHAQDAGIVAVVNDDVITSLDLEARIRLAVATSGLADTPETKARIVSQVLRSLVDELLQQQEAHRLKIRVTEDEVDGAIEGINRQRQLPPGTFERFLESRDVPLDTVRDQAEAQIAWSKVVMQDLRNRVRVSNDEVERERETLASGKDITEYNLSSLVLPVDSQQEDAEVHALADKLASEVAAGANFTMLAQQFSGGSSELVDQNQYRWVQLHQLEPVLARAVSSLKKGQISPVIRSSTGYHIIRLNDKRITNLKKVADSEVVLRQINMRLKEQAQPQEAEILLDIAREIARNPGSCMQNQVAGVSALESLEFSVKFQRAVFRELQPDVQQLLMGLRVGDVTEPYASPDGIHLVQLCERVEMPAALPPAQEVQNRLFQQKLAMESAKRLRDLRREALIDVRL